MIKRIVLEHASGLRQIGGTLAYEKAGDLPLHIEAQGLSCDLTRVEQTYALYVERPEAIAE